MLAVGAVLQAPTPRRRRLLVASTSEDNSIADAIDLQIIDARFGLIDVCKWDAAEAGLQRRLVHVVAAPWDGVLSAFEDGQWRFSRRVKAD